jgi:hypothetical protein
MEKSIVSRATGTGHFKVCLTVAVCLAVAVCISIAGCAGSDLKSKIWGDNFNDEFAHWGERQRPAGDPGNLAGVSTEAQQVERNLGVR